MRQLIFLLLSLAIACKAKQITDTITEEKPTLDFHHGSEFNALQIGIPLDLGYGISITRLADNLAAINSQTRQINQKTEGSASSFVLKDKSTVNINSGNVDKSKDKSQGDLDRSKTKTKVPGIPFLRYLWIFVLLALGIIWFFAPHIKNFFKPPFL